MRHLIATAALLTVLTTSAGSVSANDNDRAVKLAEYRKSFQTDEDLIKAVAAWRQTFSRAMQLHVDEIASDCDLNPGQKRHLEVAAKGVVERYVGRWTDAVAIRLVVMEEQDGESGFADSLFDNDELEQMSWLVGTWPLVRIMLREPVWQQALQKSLTKEQFDRLATKTRRRDARQLDVLTNWVMERLDQDYLLADKQVARLRPLVRKQLAGAEVPATEHIYGQIFTLIWPYRISEADVTEILTPTQWEIWKERSAVFTEIGDDLWTESFRVSDWFDPNSLQRDGIELPDAE